MYPSSFHGFVPLLPQSPTAHMVKSMSQSDLMTCFFLGIASLKGITGGFEDWALLLFQYFAFVKKSNSDSQEIFLPVKKR